MIKTIFFDIDGTLVSHTQNEVPESTRTSLEQLAEKGIQRVVATGRHILELPLLPVNDIRFDAYITLNGQLCLDAQGNILFGSPITGKCRDCIIRIFNEKTIPIMIVEKERMYINFVDQHVEIAQEAISTLFLSWVRIRAMRYIRHGKALTDGLPVRAFCFRFVFLAGDP